VPIGFVYALIAIVLYGVVGLFQKLATNRISAKASVLCCCVGYLLPVPYLLASTDPITASGLYLLVGFMVGVTSQLGSWFLFASLASGAKASVAVTLTALYPLFTVLLATWLLGERLTALQWLGVVLALAAGGMISFENRDAKAPGPYAPLHRRGCR
jgi:bacterial/archaeal transporter family protein